MIRGWWRWLLAYYRLDLELVCEMSRALPPNGDFHDYPDSLTPEPWHMFRHTCRRCGKHFTI